MGNHVYICKWDTKITYYSNEDHARRSAEAIALDWFIGQVTTLDRSDWKHRVKEFPSKDTDLLIEDYQERRKAYSKFIEVK